MKKLHSFGNIQKRILFVTLSCILAMCLIISYASYYIFQNYLRQSMMQSTETNLRFLSDTINCRMGDVYRMAQFCQNNSNASKAYMHRYGGTITFVLKVDDPAIYDSRIVRFTLQPLVENSIFHGIEPKGGTGRITVHACYEDSKAKHRDIRIDVTDDGVGMPPQKAAQILTDSSDNRADFFREIGVSNVHKRLQYEFGDEYGITVESIVGEYTTMSIRIPETTGENAGTAQG